VHGAAPTAALGTLVSRGTQGEGEVMNRFLVEQAGDG
jgi:hypothetical protein